jgi:hypothetical protein
LTTRFLINDTDFYNFSYSFEGSNDEQDGKLIPLLSINTLDPMDALLIDDSLPLLGRFIVS